MAKTAGSGTPSYISTPFLHLAVRATLSSVQGTGASEGIQSINIGTRIQEQKYYAPSGGIQREERMRIPMPGAALKTKLASSMCTD
jgi:hypothetical protein